MLGAILIATRYLTLIVGSVETLVARLEQAGKEKDRLLAALTERDRAAPSTPDDPTHQPGYAQGWVDAAIAFESGERPNVKLINGKSAASGNAPHPREGWKR